MYAMCDINAICTLLGFRGNTPQFHWGTKGFQEAVA